VCHFVVVAYLEYDYTTLLEWKFQVAQKHIATSRAHLVRHNVRHYIPPESALSAQSSADSEDTQGQQTRPMFPHGTSRSPKPVPQFACD
jgi:hypothetical protein